jgi:hypothetical protein
MSLLDDIREKLRSYDLWPRLNRLSVLATPTNEVNTELVLTCQTLLCEELLNSSCTGFYKAHRNHKCFENVDKALLIAWEQRTDQDVKSEIVDLDAKLVHAKTTTIKETIRQAHLELGNIYRKWGKLEESLKNFLKVREYCANPAQQVEICFRIISVSFDLNLFANVKQFLGKVLDLSADVAVRTKAMWIELSLLTMYGDFALVADRVPALVDTLPDQALGFLTASDIAMYGTLSILATKNRASISKIFTSSNLFQKHYLILQPLLRTVLHDAATGNFRNIFRDIHSLIPILSVDPITKDIFGTLVSAVEQQQMLQFLLPYEVLPLQQIMDNFNADLGKVETTISELIMKTLLVAKIDLEKGILMKVHQDSASRLIDETQALTTGHIQAMEKSFIHLGILQLLGQESRSRRVTASTATENAMDKTDNSMDISVL